ncbi:hypothetical protein D6S11_03065 [Salmonella enterica subsp. enterica]|nr:hypothetical protein [Salmonella enterica subsp. enterica serovar Isaszeg]
MDKPPLKLFLPSDISDDFCAILGEYGIKHSTEKEVSNGPSLVVNSASDTVKEIVIEIVNSTPFWTAFSACFIAYLNRNKGKKLTAEKDGVKFSLENMNHHEMTKALEDAKRIMVSNNEKTRS